MECQGKNGCTCEHCQSACKFTPGGFLPGEAEILAEKMKISLHDLFNKYLGVQYFGNEDGFIYVLAPALKKMKPGIEYPFDPLGECVFFRDGLCSIHYMIKPYHCREYYYQEKNERKTFINRNAYVSELWKDHQDQIKTLLGREPKAPRPNVAEMLDFLKKGLFLF